MGTGYVANHKWYEDQGYITPSMEYSPSERPHAELNVAPYLPTSEGAFDQAMKEYHTILPGKILGLARDNYVVPAGLRKKIAALDGTGVCWSYDTNDTKYKVLDILTGTYATATGNVVKTALAARLHTLGYIDTAAGEDAEHFFSCPVGVAPYAMYIPAGPDQNNPATFRFHNFQLQHQVGLLCDYVLELPWVPEQQAATAMADVVGVPATSTADGTNILSVQFTSAGLIPIAKDTPRVPWTFTGGAGLFTARKLRKREIRSTGDYFVDDDSNKLYFLFSGGTAAADTSLGTVAFYHYGSTTDPADLGNYACVVGDIHPGSFLQPTSKSNWKPVTKANCHFDLGTDGTFANTAVNTSTSLVTQFATNLAADFTKITNNFSDLALAQVERAETIGQVLRIFTHPKQGLERVRTDYAGADWATSYRDRLPGSASEGMPSKLTYAGGANRTVVVNIIHR